MLEPACFVIISATQWRYRLGVRTEDSQSSNPGSIPGSATKPSLTEKSALPEPRMAMVKTDNTPAPSGRRSPADAVNPSGHVGLIGKAGIDRDRA